jgi:GTPase SAR1 family protein
MIRIAEIHVAKSSILTCHIDQTFTLEQNATIELNYRVWTPQVRETKIEFHNSDRGGEEKFRALSQIYFRNAIGAIH